MIARRFLGSIGYCCTVIIGLVLASGIASAQSSILVTGTFVTGPVPMANSAVGAYVISNGQLTNTLIDAALTNDSGQFTLQLPPNQPVYIIGDVEKMGYYIDPILGLQQLNAPIRAMIVTGSTNSTMTISPYSEAATQVILGQTSSQAPALITAALINQGNAQATAFLSSVNPLTTTPLNATSASQMASATNQQKLFALSLAGFSQAQSTTSQSLSTMIANLAKAIGGGANLFDMGGGFSADPSNELLFTIEQTLQNGIATFTGNTTLNASGVTSLYNLVLAILGGPSGGTTANVPWTAACQASVTADIAAKLQPQEQTPILQQYWGTPSRYANNVYGPNPTIYPAVTIPADCNRTTWMQNRVLAVANALVQQQNNYCHHYIPAWNSTGLTFGSQTSYCFDNILPGGNNVQNGVDCSNFTAFVYNVAFGGIRFTGGVAQQGGSPFPANVSSNVWAPGTATPRPANWESYYQPGGANYQQYPFQPGDLIYVNGTPAEAAAGQPATHVVMWTGMKAADGSGRYLTVESFGTNNGGTSGAGTGSAGPIAQGPFDNVFPFNNASSSATPVTMYLNNSGPNLRFFDGTFRASNVILWRRIIPTS